MIGERLAYFTVPITTLLTTIAILLPFWWTSETFDIGFWRARTTSSSWIVIEPSFENADGRFLFTLQMVAFFSVIVSDFQGLIWLFFMLYRNTTSSLKFIIPLLVVTSLTYTSLSILLYLVWRTTTNYVQIIRISYSFYFILMSLFVHSITLISLVVRLLRIRYERRSIKPLEKVQAGFHQDNV